MIFLCLAFLMIQINGKYNHLLHFLCLKVTAQINFSIVEFMKRKHSILVTRLCLLFALQTSTFLLAFQILFFMEKKSLYLVCSGYYSGMFSKGSCHVTLSFSLLSSLCDLFLWTTLSLVPHCWFFLQAATWIMVFHGPTQRDFYYFKRGMF